MSKIEIFKEVNPSIESYWRSIMLFGKNTASNKFALGKSLLELAVKEKNIVSIEELSPYFATYIKDVANKEQVKRKLEELKDSIKNEIGIKNLIIEISDINIHERYFCSDKIIFSCDKGIDIIKNEKTLVDNLHMCIIEKKEELKIRQKLHL